MSSLLRYLSTNPGIFVRQCKTSFHISTSSMRLSSCHVLTSGIVYRCTKTTSTAWISTCQSSSSSQLKQNPLKLVTIPNVITMSRIILTPIIVYTIVNGEFKEALLLIALTGLSDALDGFIARRFNQKSLIGSILDPVADKILVTSLVISMAYVKIYPIPLTILVLLRDIGIIGIASHIVYLSIPSPANTFFQLSSIVFSVSHMLYNLPDLHYLTAIWFITAGTTLTSGFGYLRQLPNWREKAIQASKKQSSNDQT